MSNFIPAFEKEIEFDGDTIQIKMSRLSRHDLISLLPEGIDAESGVVKFSTGDLLRDLDKLSEMLPRYLQSMTGLTVEGAEVNGEKFIKEYSSQAYFTPLMDQLLTALITESSVKGDEAEKKLLKPPLV